MKKLFILSLLLLLLLAGCGGKESSPTGELQKIRIGVSPVPHGDIVNIIKEDLKEKGFELEVVEFTDYVLPNLSLDQGDLEANFFQHKPYLENFNKERGTKLIAIGDVHVEPIGLYSSKLKNINELKEGDTIAIPGDATNGARSLLLLEKQGLITLKEGAGLSATPQDILENPKKLVIKELEAAQIPRALDDVALAAINTNYALAAKLDPRSALATEEAKDNPYANALVVKEADKDKAFVKILLEVLQSQKVKDFIEKEYKGSILPAF